ncbi:MAG: phosphate starvation-inducible protein PhoH [Flavobacteriaceae bacterium]|nr:phosphate starvation-inducible protein PhoH [Flavobacteriaceae bacterium]
MNDIKIELKNINPQDFFGDQNSHLNKLKSYFPKLKLVARGNLLRAYGETKVLKEFNQCVNSLIDYYGMYNSLDSKFIEEVVSSNNKIDFLKYKEENNSIILHGVNGKIIKALTLNQIKLVETIKQNSLVFAIGPAGTGKTYTAISMAVKALKEREVKRIILTRPAVEAGENLGFLPGDLKDKLDPYMQPLYDSLKDMIPHGKLISYIEKGIIQIAPLAFMRGRTLDDAFVVLDEAQNTTHAQMKMFLTRMGKNAKFILTGDPGQIDLPKKLVSGLNEALLILKNIKGIEIVNLNESDIIRHKLVDKIIKAYKKKND